MEQLYVIYGTEHFLMKQAYEQIIRRALSDEEREWNVSTYDCEETPI
ncbi:DNA polymerase III subunit delta, partial [Anoxybacillus sp. LAT_35]|nr:DNA polymerase III subunit delta [Anoxybacillus sp. LAT_35]